MIKKIISLAVVSSFLYTSTKPAAANDMQTQETVLTLLRPDFTLSINNWQDQIPQVDITPKASFSDFEMLGQASTTNPFFLTVPFHLISFVIPGYTVDLIDVCDYVARKQILQYGNEQQRRELQITIDKESAQGLGLADAVVTQQVKEVFRLYFRGKESLDMKFFSYDEFLFFVEKREGERRFAFYPKGYPIEFMSAPAASTGLSATK